MEDIGEVAGRMWITLGEKGEVSLSQLPRMMKIKSETAYQALGWLAREGKVSYRADERGRTTVALTAGEQENYESSRLVAVLA